MTPANPDREAYRKLIERDTARNLDILRKSGLKPKQ